MLGGDSLQVERPAKIAAQLCQHPDTDSRAVQRQQGAIVVLLHQHAMPLGKGKRNGTVHACDRIHRVPSVLLFQVTGIHRLAGSRLVRLGLQCREEYSRQEVW